MPDQTAAARIEAAVPRWPATTTPKRISDSLHINPTTVQGTLRRLHNDDASDVRQASRGHYSRGMPRTHTATANEADAVVYNSDGGRGTADAEGELEIVTYSAGTGTQRVQSIVRSRVEVEITTGYDADGLIPVFVEGDSMAPLIRPNSFALALPMPRFGPPGIYAFEVDGHRVVKHVDVLLGGILRVSARNRDAYPDAEEYEPVRDADTDNTYRSRNTGRTGVVQVTGRVVAFTQVT